MVLQRTVPIVDIEITENHSRISYPNRLDNGISDKWYEWRDDLQRHMVECFEIQPEEAMNYVPFA
jgi:hypothetical protein